MAVSELQGLAKTTYQR